VARRALGREAHAAARAVHARLASISFAFAESVVVLDTARFIQGIGGACMWAAGMAWLISAARPSGAGS
jgi:MFS family permease